MAASLMGPRAWGPRSPHPMGPHARGPCSPLDGGPRAWGPCSQLDGGGPGRGALAACFIAGAGGALAACFIAGAGGALAACSQSPGRAPFACSRSPGVAGPKGGPTSAAAEDPLARERVGPGLPALVGQARPRSARPLSAGQLTRRAAAPGRGRCAAASLVTQSALRQALVLLSPLAWPGWRALRGGFLGLWAGRPRLSLGPHAPPPAAGWLIGVGPRPGRPG